MIDEEEWVSIDRVRFTAQTAQAEPALQDAMPQGE
jgi:hypothetical protein